MANKKEDADKESILKLLGLENISVDTAVLGWDFNSLEEFMAL